MRYMYMYMETKQNMQKKYVHSSKREKQADKKKTNNNNNATRAYLASKGK